MTAPAAAASKQLNVLQKGGGGTREEAMDVVLAGESGESQAAFACVKLKKNREKKEASG